MSKWSIVSSSSFTVLHVKSPCCKLCSVFTLVQRTCINTYNPGPKRTQDCPALQDRRESNHVRILVTTGINACAIRSGRLRSSAFKAALHGRKASFSHKTNIQGSKCIGTSPSFISQTAPNMLLSWVDMSSVTI